LDITPDGNYVEEAEDQKNKPGALEDAGEDKSVSSHEQGDGEISDADDVQPPLAEVSKKENTKDPKVRWLVER
jgi:hypothetical protein